MTNFDKIVQLMQTLKPENIELGLMLAEGNMPDFRVWFEDRVTEILADRGNSDWVNRLTENDFLDYLDFESCMAIVPEAAKYSYNGVFLLLPISRHILFMEYGSSRYLTKCTCPLNLPHCNYKNNCLPF